MKKNLKVIYHKVPQKMMSSHQVHVSLFGVKIQICESKPRVYICPLCEFYKTNISGILKHIQSDKTNLDNPESRPELVCS